MIGPPEILILLVLLVVVSGPVAAGIVIWKYVVKPNKSGPGAPPEGRN